MAPVVATALEKKLSAVHASRSVSDIDLVRSYFRDLGGVPLLSLEQEITLDRQVQELVNLEFRESELEENLGQ